MKNDEEWVRKCKIDKFMQIKKRVHFFNIYILKRTSSSSSLVFTSTSSNLTMGSKWTSGDSTSSSCYEIEMMRWVRIEQQKNWQKSVILFRFLRCIEMFTCSTIFFSSVSAIFIYSNVDEKWMDGWISPLCVILNLKGYVIVWPRAHCGRAGI